MNLIPLLFADGYKTSHRVQYPEGTELVYVNFTPRKSRIEGIEYMTFFGLQYAIKEYLVKQFNENFFNRDKQEVLEEYKAELDAYLMTDYDVDHIAALHDLGYLPIHIKAVPEGINVPIGCPAMVMWNTVPEFFWLPNYMETMMSNLLWKPSTSATTASVFKQRFEAYAKETGVDPSFVPFQGHDFSYRGMSMTEDALVSGAGHLIHFLGTDTLPAIPFIREYYGSDDLIGCSVPATEHSVMCAGGMVSEFDTFKRLITETYPSGIVSIVSDTWDFWQVVTKFLPALKDEILARDGKVVIRPDSGTPHLIVNGDIHASSHEEKKGLIRCLDATFGSNENEKGFRHLNPKIGAIYGDGIDHKEQDLILNGIRNNGFATDCIVLGMGSFTYQYVTRDTFGTVCKATYCEINGVPHEIFKSPKTGAWKKSHKGLLRVNEDLSYEQCVSWDREGGIMETVFLDGEIKREQTFDDIRRVAKGELLGV